MKKNDYILIAGIAVIAVILCFLYPRIWNDNAAAVEITVDGKHKESHSLSKDCKIEINGTNVLVIKDGKADMVEADCPDKICVKQKPISKAGESITCLPNKVMVTVVGRNSKKSLDVIAE